MKKTVSLILAVILVLSSLPALEASAEIYEGKCGVNLTYSYVYGAGGIVSSLTVKGSGKMYDYTAENPAPWHEFASQIKSVSLPSSGLESIGDYAFADCATLEEITLPELDLTHIGKGTFKNSGLTGIVIPYDIERIEDETFSGCTSLKKVELKEVTTSAKTYGVDAIGDSAFSDCYALESIAFPSTVVSIGNDAFYSCESLKSVNFNDTLSIEKIGSGAFAECIALASFDLPAKLTSVSAEMFSGCVSLSKAVLGSAVTSVGENAFAFCDSLSSLTVNNDECSFFDSSDTVSDSATIYCKVGAAKAISYAKRYNKAYTVRCIGMGSHLYGAAVVAKANGIKNGSVSKTCRSCGYVSTSVISRIKSAVLSKTSLTYNGKTQYPSVSVTDAAGKKISSSYYKISRVTNCKYVGKHAVKIVFSGNYSGTITRYFYILPKGTALRSVTPSYGKLKVNWYKQSSQTSGYQVSVCKSSSFKSGVKTYTFRSTSKLSYTVSGLSRRKGYYVRVRTFKTVGKSNYFSSWSKIIGRKTK